MFVVSSQFTILVCCCCEQEIQEGRRSIQKLANQWYQEVRTQVSDTDHDDDDEQVEFDMNGSLLSSAGNIDSMHTSTM